ncbi:MAG TPA: hypothetical protein VKA18_05565 [Alphaproteobacteria bacterium]|nr:hypothetical protein [Alphaproteobacteria bacterium]
MALFNHVINVLVDHDWLLNLNLVSIDDPGLLIAGLSSMLAGRRLVLRAAAIGRRQENHPNESHGMTLREKSD